MSEVTPRVWVESPDPEEVEVLVCRGARVAHLGKHQSYQPLCGASAPSRAVRSGFDWDESGGTYRKPCKLCWSQAKARKEARDAGTP
jgi:hypothetical protein